MSGLTLESEPIEYRGWNDQTLTVRKLPGREEFGNLTLQRGVVPPENGNFKLFETSQSGVVGRLTVTTSLLNADHEIALSRETKAAWLVKAEGPSLDVTGNEVAMETLEVAHEAGRPTGPQPAYVGLNLMSAAYQSHETPIRG